MKNRNWLDISEYALLLGSGVGTIASIASQQIAYTAAPLSCVMLLNLMNRRRLLKQMAESNTDNLLQLDRRLSSTTETLLMKVQVMPEMEDIHSLKKSLLRQERKLTEQFREELSQLEQRTTEQLTPLQEHNLSEINQEVHQLQGQCNRLRESLNEIASYQHRLATSARVDTLSTVSAQLTEEMQEVRTEFAQLVAGFQGLVDDQKLINPRTLQEQIDHLNRRLSNLPQSFDASALKQDVESLLSVVTDLVSRREFARLLTDVELLSQQCRELDQTTRLSKISGLIFRKQLEKLSTQLSAREEAIDWMSSAIFQPEQATPGNLTEQMTQLQRQLQRLEERMNQRPADVPNLDLLRSDLQQAIAAQVSELQQQLATVQQSTSSLAEEQATLQSQVNCLPAAVDNTPVEQQLHLLAERVAGTETNLGQLQQQIEQTIRSHMETVVLPTLAEGFAQPGATIEQQPPKSGLEQLHQEIQAAVATQVEELRQQVSAIVAAQVQELRQQISMMQHLIENLEQQQVWIPHLEEQGAQTQTMQVQLETLAERLELAELSLNTIQLQIDTTIQTQLAQFSQQFQLERSPAPNSLEEFTQDLTNLETTAAIEQADSVDRLQQQVLSLQELIQKLEQEQLLLRQRSQADPDTTTQQELQQLTTRLTQAEAILTQLQSQLTTTLQQQAVQQLHPAATHHELLFDLKSRSPLSDKTDSPAGSRAVLEAALAQVQERIVIVWPWPSPDNLDEALIGQFEALLQRGVRIDIGWGHLGDTAQIRQPRLIAQPKPIDAEGRGFLYFMLKRLAQIKERYPRQFGFKILGTYENFLVCDQAFAVLSVHPVPTASSVYPELTVGLRSRDPQVIQGLLERFDQPVLDASNANAYFNRATTRYDLGDRQGAISDYTQVLQINPDDAIACNNRALAYAELNDRPSAMVDLDRALQLDSQNPAFSYNRGFILAEAGDFLGAVTDYGRALQYQPDFALAYLQRGLVRMRLGNREGAIEDFTATIRLTPNDAMAHLYRGLAHFKRGERTDAADDLRQAAHLFAQRKDKVNRQRALDALVELEQALSGNLNRVTASR